MVITLIFLFFNCHDTKCEGYLIVNIFTVLTLTAVILKKLRDKVVFNCFGIYKVETCVYCV